MGVFDEMPTDGTPITTTELASRLNVNEELLGTINIYDVVTKLI
jgi:hypothetical protein